MRLVPDRGRRRRGRGGRRPPLRDRRVSRARPLHERADRAHPRDAQPCRPRLRAWPPRRGDRRDDPQPPRRSARLRARAVRRRLGARARFPGGAGDPHAGAPARAHRLRPRGPRAWRRAVGRSHWRHAVRQRRGATGPRDRQGGGCAWHLSVAPRQALEAAARDGGVARPPRRVALRRAGNGPQGLLDDRLRAPPQRAVRRVRRGSASSNGRSRSFPPSRRTSRRSWRSTAGPS